MAFTAADSRSGLSLRVFRANRAFLLGVLIALCCAGFTASDAFAVANGAVAVRGTFTASPLGPSTQPLSVAWNGTDGTGATNNVFVTLATGVNTGSVVQITSAGASTFGGITAPATWAGYGANSFNFPGGITFDVAAALPDHVNFCSNPSTVSSSSGRLCNGSTVNNTIGQSNNSGGAESPFSFSGTACQNPADITSGGNDSVLWVSCAGNGRVGLGSGGSAGTTVALAANAVPSGIAAASSSTANTTVCAGSTQDKADYALVADAHNNTVTPLIWCTSGNPSQAASVPTVGSPVSVGANCTPAEVAVDRSTASLNNVYVACPGNGTIQSATFTPSSGVISAFTPNTVPGTLPAPYGISVGSTDLSLTVTDPDNDQVVVWTKATAIGATLSGLNPTALDVRGGVGTCGTPCNGNGSDPNPAGVAAAGSSVNAFVANQSAGTITVVDPPVAKKQLKRCKKIRKSKRATRKSKAAACRGLKLSYRKVRRRSVRSAATQANVRAGLFNPIFPVGR